MFKKTYIVVDINGHEQIVNNLYELIKSMGIRRFNYMFGDQFEKISWNQKYNLPDAERAKFAFDDKDGFYSSCNYKILNLAGNVIPKAQVLSEYIELNPKEIDDLIYRFYFRVSGFAAEKRRRKYGRGNRKKSFARVMKNQDDECFEGVRIKKIKRKDRELLQEMKDWYTDYERRHFERNWKRYRKTQYK